MSELKVKYSDDSEFNCIRRIATMLGLSMPESDDEVLNLSQYRRIERAISKEFELLPELTAIATKHATRADELYETLENQILILEGYKRLMIHPLSIQDDIDDLRSALDKSRIEAEKGYGICN